MNLYLLKTSEIIIKGKNRAYFEKIFFDNLRKYFENNLKKIENWGGEYLVELEDASLEEKFKKIFGINSVIKIIFVAEELEKTIDFLINYLQEKSKREKIKIVVKRKDKDYKLNSKEIYDLIKDKIKNFTNHFEKESKIFVIYYRKKFYLGELLFKCSGGLPVGSSGHGLVLLSTGFDSPVASYLIMKRGLKLSFLHFHSYPQTSLENVEKVKKLVRILNEYNLGSVLYLMNILDIQKFYFQNVPTKYLVIFYRRTMMRLATRLAKEINAKVLITGENLGQVASQTIENLKAIEDATDMLILRPLIAFNKEEIIKLAENIGTKQISELPGQDCCSLFIPKHPETKAKLSEIKEIENKIWDDIVKIEEKIYKSKETELFK